jgi:lysophospholipase L1-like esterase
VEQAAPALLERELNGRGGRWEVLNAGVQGYNTTAELAWLRQRGFALAPEVVVLLFNLNDYDFAPVLGPLGILTREHRDRVGTWSIANVSELYLLLRWLVLTRGRFAGTGLEDTPVTVNRGQRFADLDAYASALRKQYWRQPSDARWPAMVAALEALGAETQRHGIRVVVAILPDGDQLGVPDPDLVPQAKLRDLCAAARLDCLDLHPAFAAAGPGEIHLDTMHPNAAGQAVVARALANHLAPP